MARILVTGSKGLVGTAVRPVLTRHGHEVQGFDLAAPPDHTEHGDVLDPALLQARIRDVDGVLHLAAVSRVADGEADPERCRAVNVTGTENVVRAAAAAPHRPWVIVASSREVYGEPERLPVQEDDPVRPLNTYGRSKAGCEAVTLAAREQGVATTVVRLASVYGSVEDHPGRVIPAFCRAAAKGGVMRVEGPEYTFDFTHVADVAAGLARLVARMIEGGPPPPVLHFVSGVPTTLGHLAAMAGAAGGDRSTIEIVTNKPYNVSRFVGDPARAERILGWRTEIPIEQGVRALVAEFATIDQKPARRDDAAAVASAPPDRRPRRVAGRPA